MTSGVPPCMDGSFPYIWMDCGLWPGKDLKLMGRCTNYPIQNQPNEGINQPGSSASTRDHRAGACARINDPSRKDCWNVIIHNQKLQFMVNVVGLYKYFMVDLMVDLVPWMIKILRKHPAQGSFHIPSRACHGVPAMYHHGMFTWRLNCSILFLHPQRR